MKKKNGNSPNWDGKSKAMLLQGGRESLQRGSKYMDILSSFQSFGDTSFVQNS